MKMLEFVAKCEEPEKLKTLIVNARKEGANDLAEAAFRKLIALIPSEKPGTVEHDFWQTVHAFEYLLSDERQKTTRLSRTRQKVQRDGVVQTLKDWALSKKATDGFDMLLERNMAELTGEAIVLRHANEFSHDVVAAASKRLTDAGVDLTSLRPARHTR
ncbi:MAG TPA: hypothetical protein VNW15_08425 [Rhizomicrobium sp.]|nr:hypothetical protein [Rhizomicrobium sp.]